MNNQENYISLEEAATYLGVKPTTLRSWIKKPGNDIPAYKIGRMWKFKRSELDEWVNSGKSAIDD
ncbi:MAG: helix-turn-helix domain-containing protein [Coprococcus sp.]|nr:helix-turn-helix domain-containing protein [Coprococcus sp.]